MPEPTIQASRAETAGPGPSAPPGPHWPRRATAAALAAAGAALLAVGLPALTAAAVGESSAAMLMREFPGLEVMVPVAALRGVAEVTSVLVVGALLRLLLLDDDRGPRLTRQGLTLTTLRVASVGWATATGLLVVLDALDAAGARPEVLVSTGGLSYVYGATDWPKAWTVACLAAVVVSVGAQLATRWVGLLVPLVAAVVGILAPVVVGQVLVGRDHDIASDVGALQAVAVAAALGSLVIRAMLRLSRQEVGGAADRRLALLLTLTIPVVAGSEVVLAWFKLAGTAWWVSVSGWQLAGRGGVVVLLVVVTVMMLRAGRHGVRPPALALPAAGLLLGAWAGLTAAMTRVPPPHYFADSSILVVFFGFDVTRAPGLAPLLLDGRPNVLLALLAASAAGLYLVAVRRLRRGGLPWSRARTAAWLGGWSVVVLATSSGLGRYSGPDLAVHMGVHMALGMLAPLLMSLGGAVTLAVAATNGVARLRLLRLLGWEGWRLVQHPVVVLLVFVGSSYVLYTADLVGEAMRYHWAHQLMNLHVLVWGYLFFALVAGVDRPAVPMPQVGKLAYLIATMPLHAVVGVLLMTGETLVAENFYRQLDLPWADLRRTQELAGLIGWVGGAATVMAVVVALGVQWTRQDQDRARDDRGPGSDHETRAYEQALDDLTRRSRPALEPRIPQERP